MGSQRGWGVLGLALAQVALGAARPPLLDKAIDQLKHLDEAQALLTLEKARAWPGNTPEHLAEIYLYTGLAHAGLSHHDEAVDAFVSSLRLNPTQTLPADSSPRISEWWAQAQQRALRTPAPPLPNPPAPWRPTPDAAPVEAQRSLRWAPWVLAGAGVAAVAVGAALGVSARSQEAAWRAEPAVGRARALRETAASSALAANVLFGVGGAAVVGGGAWFVIQL